jgi:hypothetical protein
MYIHKGGGQWLGSQWWKEGLNAAADAPCPSGSGQAQLHETLVQGSSRRKRRCVCGGGGGEGSVRVVLVGQCVGGGVEGVASRSR